MSRRGRLIIISRVFSIPILIQLYLQYEYRDFRKIIIMPHLLISKCGIIIIFLNNRTWRLIIYEARVNVC